MAAMVSLSPPMEIAFRIASSKPVASKKASNACGTLPKRNLHFREIGDIATDETATVIFAADAKALEAQLRNAMPQPAPVPAGKIAGDFAKGTSRMLLKDIIRNALK